MVENFNGIFYFIIFLIVLAMNSFYGFNCLFNTRKFLEKYAISIEAAFFCRFAGSVIAGVVIIQLYILFRGLESTWIFFNYMFVFSSKTVIFEDFAQKIHSYAPRFFRKLCKNDRKSQMSFDSLFKEKFAINNSFYQIEAIRVKFLSLDLEMGVAILFFAPCIVINSHLIHFESCFLQNPQYADKKSNKNVEDKVGTVEGW